MGWLLNKFEWATNMNDLLHSFTYECACCNKTECLKNIPWLQFNGAKLQKYLIAL